MGETRASSGVSGNNTAKKKPARVVEVNQEELDKRIEKYTEGGKKIFAGCGMFETTDRNLVQSDATGSSSGSVIMDTQIVQNFDNVKGPGVFVPLRGNTRDLENAKKDKKGKDSKETQEQDEQEQEQEDRE